MQRLMLALPQQLLLQKPQTPQQRLRVLLPMLQRLKALLPTLQRLKALPVAKLQRLRAKPLVQLLLLKKSLPQAATNSSLKN
jgi:hypothetical protein